MMWKCRNCHLRETKFAKFHGFIGDHTPRWPTSLEACTLGTCVSAFVACVASVCSGVIARKLERKQKKG